MSGWRIGRHRGGALLVLCFVVACSASGRSAPKSLPQSDDVWFQQGERTLAEARARRPIGGRAKNVVLFVGDGLDVSTVTAARIFAGQRRGASGEENVLAFERLPYRALLKTYNTNQQVADSAGAATALLSGVKTKAGVIGLDDGALRGDCASAAGHEVASLFDLAQAAGMATGIVTTTRFTHATPAAAYAHSPERNWEADSDMPAQAREAGCVDLARQFVESDVGAGVHVALGGGGAYFLPTSARAPDGEPGRRTDGRDLIEQWRQRHPDGRFVSTREELLAVDPARTPWLLGLFGADHMAFEADRDRKVEPSLAEMTARALDLLAAREDGFLLLVEAGRIDHAHHYDNAYRALAGTEELARAVSVVLERTDAAETLVIVTADHGHTMTIAGYPTRGNPILGLVTENDDAGRPRAVPSLARDGKPYTTLSYANGPSAPRGARVDLDAVDTTAPGFQQPAAVPLGLETHGGADVPAYAEGPMAHLLVGTAEQSYVFQVVRHAAGFDGSAAAARDDPD